MLQRETREKTFHFYSYLKSIDDVISGVYPFRVIIGIPYKKNKIIIVIIIQTYSI